MALKSEYQRRFAADYGNLEKENYKDMVEFRRRKKSYEFRHTPLSWLDENADVSSDENTILENKTNIINTTSDIDNSIVSLSTSKSVQTTPASVTRKDVASQSPERCTRKSPRVLKKILKNSVINHEKPIISYGWADKTSNWKKRTFNVKAPSAEVRQSALRAAKQRDNNLKKRLTKKERLQNEKLKKEALLDSLTNFNEWQTEYQKQFCKYKK